MSAVLFSRCRGCGASIRIARLGEPVICGCGLVFSTFERASRAPRDASGVAAMVNDDRLDIPLIAAIGYALIS